MKKYLFLFLCLFGCSGNTECVRYGKPHDVLIPVYDTNYNIISYYPMESVSCEQEEIIVPDSWRKAHEERQKLKKLKK